jgi:uncharacterized protein (DUF427 family)
VDAEGRPGPLHPAGPTSTLGSMEKATGAPVEGFPQTLTPVDHVEPVPRRVRARLAGEWVLDTTRALYVWEWPYYPQYYVPLGDVNTDRLADDQHHQRTHRGETQLFSLVAGGLVRPEAVRLHTASHLAGIEGTARFEWEALDQWFEEDEEVFVHPRNPYTRVDALRSTRRVRIELEGIVLAESSSPVMVFETGLPTRYYLNQTDVDGSHLVVSGTETECPYKGRTTGYWSVRVGDSLQPDLAWKYDFPTRQLLPIAGLIAFYNEKVDVFVDGELQARPVTHFS